MKTIELKKVDQFDYKSQLIGIMEQPINPREGAQIDEVRKSMRVIRALESAEGKAELEDADYAFLKAKVKAIGFRLINPIVEGFLDDIVGRET